MIQEPLDRPMRQWRPQAFGRSRSARITDPVIEPLWIGERVLLHVAGGALVDGSLGTGAALSEWSGADEELPPLLDAVAAAVAADTAVLDGYLTRQPAQPSEGRIAGLETAERPNAMRRLLLGGAGRGELERRERVRTAARELEEAGHPLAFVAVDLLALDGEPLLDVPLLERKRHLGAIVEERELVRVGQFVRGPAARWYGTWRAIGFLEMALKAANSRYRPGEASPDWAVAQIPRR